MVPMLEENKQGFCKRYPNRWLGLSDMIFFVVVLQSGRFLSVFENCLIMKTQRNL